MPVARWRRLVIAALTFGEGWHNNHHHYPNSTRQGFYWWEIDITYYVLRFMSLLGLVWDLRPVPKRVLQQATAVRKVDAVSELGTNVQPS